MPGTAGSANENKVLSAPLAIIEVGGISIGKIRDLQFTENVQRGEVQGLGELTLSEVPPLTVRCSFTASSYMIDMKKFGSIPNPFWPVNATTVQEFANTITLQETPVNLHVYSKIPSATNGSIVTDISKFKLGVATNCYLDSKTFQITENQIAATNISGRYLEPFITG